MFILAETINCHGHVIRPGKLEIAELTTKTIRQLQDPINYMDYERFSFNVAYSEDSSQILAGGNGAEREAVQKAMKIVPVNNLRSKSRRGASTDMLKNQPVFVLPRATGD